MSPALKGKRDKLMVNIADRLYVSKAGFFHVWRLSNTIAIYNQNGIRVGSFVGTSQRSLDMAKLAADALEKEFQW